MSDLKADHISLAYKIATTLWDEEMRGGEGVAVLAMAMGIYMDAQEGAHREFRPVVEAVCHQAQEVFDSLQAHRFNPGHA